MIVLITLLFSPPVQAVDELKQGVPTDLAKLEQKIIEQPDLADLIGYAYRSSPLIKAARAEWRASVEQYRVTTSFDDPEVMVEGMYMSDAARDFANPEDWKVSLVQPIPLPGKLAKAGDVATSEAQISRLRLDLTVRDTTLRIRESYQELLYLREAKRLAAANRELLDQLRKAGETASSSVNRASLVDVMKAQAQTGQVGYDMLLLEESALTEQVRLNSILNRPAEAAIGPLRADTMLPVLYSLQEIYPLAEVNLEEIRIAQANINKAQAMVDLTRYDTLPRFTFGVSYGDLNQKQQLGVQAGLSLPLWHGKNAGRMAAAQAESDKTRAQWSAEVNEARIAAREVYFRLQNSERLVRLYRDDLIPQANRAMQTAETWYSQNQGSFSDYIETVATWYNFQLASARARADYGTFLARLESIAGRPLTERGAKAEEVPPVSAEETK
ncbi:MAG: TolC family protein [Desulfobulbaceae bacterium]|nr:TolC family protein [Desulfobulbaceae bacterium]